MTLASTNRIDAMFARLRAEGRPAAIYYLTVGYPSPAATGGLLRALEAGGADLIELGIPFSDPIADGPTIQKASQAALDAGTRVADAFRIAREFRAGSELPVVFFTAFNPVWRHGADHFAKLAADAGADGLLVPDLPPEEADEVEAACAAHGLRLIFLVAPTSTPERRRAIAARASGFLYYISLRGVTGARADLPSDLADNVRALKAETDVPVAVGFGISTPEQAAIVGGVADGFVVGSALINRIAGALEASGGAYDAGATEAAVRDYARSLGDGARR